MEEIINPNESELDLDEYKLRPQYLREYIGQDDVKENLNVFIKASMEHKVNLSKEKHDLTNKEAKNILAKRDKERSKHYYFYTGQNWGDAKNYHLVLDSGILGEDTCVKLIVEAFKNS